MTRTKVAWSLNIVLLIGFAAVIIFLVTRDDDDDVVSADPPVTTTTTTTTPINDYIPDGPEASTLRRLAKDVDMSDYDVDDDEWEFAVVSGSKGETLLVRTSRTAHALIAASSCKTAELTGGYFELLFGEGDLVLFSHRGSDERICPGEIYLVKEA